MLSYRHAYHVGNHADVLKHTVLVQLLNYLKLKDVPLWYVESHAGAGLYALNSPLAKKHSEFAQGIGRLWGRCDLPEILMAYLGAVSQQNKDERLLHYPGSPVLASFILRKKDRLRLFERHSRDVQLLWENLQKEQKRIAIEAKDGFSGLKSVLPPPSRRALVLIDPSYEEKKDYIHAVNALKDSLARFATGTYVLWYPRLNRLESHELPQRLKRLPVSDWLHVALHVSTPGKNGFGMYGSGLFIINPPWTLHDKLKEAMPILSDLLKQEDNDGFLLEQKTG